MHDLIPGGEMRFKIGLIGNCHCGGRLIQKPGKLTWYCSRSHWWNRKKHAYLVGSIESALLDSARDSAAESVDDEGHP